MWNLSPLSDNILWDRQDRHASPSVRAWKFNKLKVRPHMNSFYYIMKTWLLQGAIHNLNDCLKSLPFVFWPTFYKFYKLQTILTFLKFLAMFYSLLVCPIVSMSFFAKNRPSHTSVELTVLIELRSYRF